MSYNVKFYKYPSGWQVRVYSKVVGYPDNRPDILYLDEEPILWPMWDDEEGYVYQWIHPEKDTWINPFTGNEEPMPKEWNEKEEERKKARSIASSMGRTVNAVYRIARANTWDWFVTFTFNPELVDSLDYTASVKKLSLWLNNMKKISPGMGYLIVPEKHESGRYHFHGLFKNCSALNFVWSGYKDNKGNKIYNVGKYKFGFTTATRITSQERVTKYIAKYINKDLCQVAFNKKRYWCSRNLDEPEVTEVTLDNDKRQLLLASLAEKAVYVKRVENAEVELTYFELPEGVCNEEW